MFGYEVVARTIAVLGFDHVFALMGNGNLSWLSFGVDHDLFRYIPVRREDAAVGAAAGYARSSGKVGLATVTHGPGLGNCYTALTAAVKDNSPIVVLIGVPALNNPTALQRMDHHSMTVLTGAAYHAVEHPAKIGTSIAKAMHAALREKRPQVVGIYHDMFETDVEMTNLPFTGMEASIVRVAPDASAISQAVDLIEQASRPLVVAGQGAAFSECRDAIELFGDDIGALFCDTMLGRHMLAGSPFAAGMIGISAHPMTDRFIADTDLVLIVGASLNFSQTRRFKLFEGKKVILIENSPQRVPDFQPIDHVLVGDARATLEALHAEWNRRGHEARIGARAPELLRKMADFRVYDPAEDTSSEKGVDPRAIYDLLEASLPDDKLIVTDGGRVIETLHHVMRARDSRSYLYCSGFASIGLGLGASIGAGLANPGRILLHITGDGGFLMSAQELDTVVRSGMQMLVFVMNDCQYGSEVRHIDHMSHRGHDLGTAAARFETPYLDALSRAYGGDGEVIRNAADLADFRLTEDKLKGLYLVDVRVDPDFDPWHVWAPSKFI